jgi:hypothetical protein
MPIVETEKGDQAMDEQETDLQPANKLARLAQKASTAPDGTPLNHLELPLLDRKLLNVLFDCVYQLPAGEAPLPAAPPANGYMSVWRDETLQAIESETLRNFLVMVDHMVRFNHYYRWDMNHEAFYRLDRYFNFETNSEGTDCWLGRVIAIKDLYQMGWGDTVKIMRMVEVRK